MPRVLAWAVVVSMAWACLPGCGSADGRRGRVRIGRGEWRVEIASREASRTRGLSGRRQVPAGTGMLFAFPREELLYFHMRDCYVPLDIAFISADMRVVHVRTMVVEDDPADPKAIYSSRFPARFALEVPAGELRGAGVKVGDHVELLGWAGRAAKDAR